MYKIVEGYIQAQIKGEYKTSEGKFGYNQRKENGKLVEDYVDITGTADNILRWNPCCRQHMDIG